MHAASDLFTVNSFMSRSTMGEHAGTSLLWCYGNQVLGASGRMQTLAGALAVFDYHPVRTIFSGSQPAKRAHFLGKWGTSEEMGAFHPKYLTFQ